MGQFLLLGTREATSAGGQLKKLELSAAKMEVNRGAGEMVFFSWLKQQKPGNLSTGLSMVKHRF